MPASTTEIEPFFMGLPERQLFACYHLPTEPARDCGVLICYPSWQEYIRSHRACLLLARRLARAGFPVLRVDYYGTGDSAGDSGAADLEQWKGDLRQAIAELRDRTGVAAISLVGLRLGASLATELAVESRDIASLVLWDPVVSGESYLEETLGEHRDAIYRFHIRPKSVTSEERPSEILGFQVSRRLYDAVRALDLLGVQRSPAPKVLIIESHTGEQAERLAEQLTACGAHTSHQHVPCFKLWTESVDKGLVPTPVLTAISDWLSEVHQ
jgi:pimeloyl-ACP methyl ester carboxylesterase